MADGTITRQWSVDKDGCAPLPQGAGLGVEVDEAKLEELSKNPKRWTWPLRGRLKDGSVADY
jgi:hypothetical protein